MSLLNKTLCFGTALVMGLLCACSGSTKQALTPEEEAAEFRASLTGADSAAVLQMSDATMNLFKDGKVEEAVASFKAYDDSTATISDLTPERADQLVKQFKMFPVYDYTVTEFVFTSPTDNIMKYQIAFAPAGADGAAPTINFTWRPIKKDGTWYLTVK